jgi:hypothetical protein
LTKTTIVCDYCKQEIDDKYYSLNTCSKPIQTPSYFAQFTDGITFKFDFQKDMCLDCFKKVENELAKNHV